MSGFLFNRGDKASQDRRDADEQTARTIEAVLDAQSMTASAIFALLVMKGVITAEEAGRYMEEIAEALGRDVPLVGERAGERLASYGAALRAAGG